jgi:hypothetical protein
MRIRQNFTWRMSKPHIEEVRTAHRGSMILMWRKYEPHMEELFMNLTWKRSDFHSCRGSKNLR